MKSIDLHGLELSEAIIEIVYCIREMDLSSDNMLEIVHGYHSGRVLKNYIRSKRFLQDINNEGYKIVPIKSNSNNAGASYFKVSLR